MIKGSSIFYGENNMTEFTKVQKCTDEEKEAFELTIFRCNTWIKHLDKEIALLQKQRDNYRTITDSLDHQIYDYEPIDIPAVYTISRQGGFAEIYKDGKKCEDYFMMPAGKAQGICDKLNLEIHESNKGETKNVVE